MATRGPVAPQAAAIPATQLCGYCHLKPKFAGHLYCSKTCGTQAATLCNYCHKKPKFQNFEYCGKNCANLANPGGKPVGAAAAAWNPAAGGQPKAKVGATHAPTAQGLSLDPMAIAKLVAQQLPQVQALLNGSKANAQQAHVPSSRNPQGQAAGSNGIPPTQLQSSGNGVNYGAHPNSLGLGGVGVGGHGMGGGYPQQQQQQPDAADLDCLIPGCGKPVHVDTKGMKASDFCSQRHREEAVKLGLVDPCIMCLTKAQTRSDYFCSRACREEASHKQQQQQQQQQQQRVNLPNGDDSEEDWDDAEQDPQ